MENRKTDPRLRVMQQADLKDKIVLVRVDHNVVKKGRIIDPYRIDATIGTLYKIAAKGGKPILMTHVGRPKDKKTGNIKCSEGESTKPVAEYISQKLSVKIHVQEFPADPEKGILHLDDSIKQSINRLKNGETEMVYLPNTRWFSGEQAKGAARSEFAKELAAIADVYINDAFGSWQAHASTFDIASLIPSYAGNLLQKELINTQNVLEPQGPFVGIIAGAKYDTKIGPLKSLHERVDHLILGGLIYNTYLSAKYGVQIEGVTEEDRVLAKELVELDAGKNKILELPFLVESDLPDSRTDGKYRTVDSRNFKEGVKFNYILDVAPASFENRKIRDAIGSAKTIFVNAVMGLMPHFHEGSESLYSLITENKSALKLFGGGDTLQELKNLCPGRYMAGIDSPDNYYFTGGGSVLTAIEQGSPYGLEPVKALMNG